MLRVIKIIIMLALLVLVPSAAVASPVSYTYADNYKNWVGWEVNPYDNISNPLVEEMTITIDDGKLQSIAIHVENRLTWDTLFINTNWSGYREDYQSWDFYVIDGYAANENAEIYRVAGVYEYFIVDNADWRKGHPSAIKSGWLDPGTATVKETYNSETDMLLYEFTNVPITSRFVVGYSQFCANDVFLTPVPEPSTMLLLGLGFAGFALLRRRN